MYLFKRAALPQEYSWERSTDVDDEEESCRNTRCREFGVLTNKQQIGHKIYNPENKVLIKGLHIEYPVRTETKVTEILLFEFPVHRNNTNTSNVESTTTHDAKR
uniref:Uncharacterized protein n=1 Tax=Timema poppense TaxID=170557 RepID=A0A7R9DH07_TIMPO|nr:unnamed protein product [Timema poppensis]